MTAVAGLLLAAGAGRRFGSPKALVRYEGRTLLERGVQVLTDGGCDPVVVVLGADAERARRHVPAGAQVVVAELWDEGMGASLRAGLGALTRGEAPACVVALVDQPLVGPEAVRRLASQAGRTDAAVATYGGQQRNPVLLDRSVWAAVRAAAVGDTGARGWLRDHPDRVLPVPCDDTGSPDDVDVPADLDRLSALRPQADRLHRTAPTARPEGAPA